MNAWGLLGYGIVITLLVILWVVVALYIIRNNRRKAAEAALYGVPMDHTSLYFTEYFPTMIINYDLVTKPQLQEWSKAISGRLDTIDGRITTAGTSRKRMDSRIKILDGRIEKLEKA
jgi:hypothetical protein